MEKDKGVQTLKDPLFEIDPNAMEAPLNWDAILGRTAPLAVEIGPGRGVSLVRTALAHPKFNFAAIEMRRKRVALCIEKLARGGVTHVRLIRGRAEELIPKLFQPRSVSRWYICFPDPWPKRNHQRRRIIQPAFVRTLANFTAPKGVVFLATDVHEYGDQMLSCFESNGGWRNFFGKGRWTESRPEECLTSYEEKYLRMRKVIRYYKFERCR